MIGKILWQPHGGYYLFWCSAVYLTVGMIDVFMLGSQFNTQIQIAWISALSAPFWCPAWGRWLNMDVTWDKKMLNWFKNKSNKQEADNVVKFPELTSVPQVEPPKKEEPAKTFYRLGLTDNNRVSFSMGYSEITMNHTGCQQMIDQLKFFQSQLQGEEDNA